MTTPISLPPGNVQVLPDPRTTPKGDVLLAWNTGQARSDPPTDYLATGKRKASSTDLWRLPVDARAFRLSQKITAEQRTAWLNSGPTWKWGALDQRWTGVKVLGIGGNGIAGLWEKTAAAATGSGQGTKEKVVVKQIGNDFGAKIEASYMKDFKDNEGIKHVVKLLAGLFLDTGTGVLPFGKVDPNDQPVTRFIYTAMDPVPEEHIWQMFKCLALALVACAHGSENPASLGWGKELVHFDIKPENIFLQRKDVDHPNTFILKLGDFGPASFVPLIQDKEYVKGKMRRGTRGWDGPETFDPGNVKPLRYGTPYNVWQVGKCMYNLINRLRTFDSKPNTEVFWVQFDDTSAGETYGRYILDAPYSAKLRRLIYRCLSRQPDLRLRPRALIAEIQAVVDGTAAAASTATAANVGPAVPAVRLPAPILCPEPDSSVSSRVTNFSA
ncbi:kinase-like protein [Cadophora sp. DSE1049]|nr:kinase-like protein [Cadophora sp. DSE1049]